MMNAIHCKSNKLLVEAMRNFFLQVPFRCLHEKLKDYILQNVEIVFSQTFSHEINQKYPLKRCFQVSFLKALINELEKRSEDVDEKIYHYYLELLSASNDETHYIHYMVHSGQFITIQQSTNTISHGTTGLSVWQAGRVLADYCAENITLFEKRKVLELGCGVGLTGLSVIFTCRPLHYCFTDVHKEVLNYLVKNIRLNAAIIHSREDGQNAYFESTNLESKISVVNLCWGNVDSNLFTSFDPDVILAADVVYDSTLFHPFCTTITEFIKRNENVKIIMACTVRNVATLEEFFTILHQYDLIEDEIKSITSWDSSFRETCSVKLFSLRSTNKFS